MHSRPRTRTASPSQVFLTMAVRLLQSVCLYRDTSPLKPTPGFALGMCVMTRTCRDPQRI